MSEKIITCCDICNQEKAIAAYKHGRGYIEATEKDAIELFDWVMTPKGIMCLDCQDEEKEDFHK